MRGGLFRDHIPPYTSRDLEAEFGATHALGAMYDPLGLVLHTALRHGDPPTRMVTDESRLGLARKLRAQR